MSQKKSLDGHYPSLNGLSYAIGYLEQCIAIISEPFLIAAAVIAYIDFATHGGLLSIPAITYSWASVVAIAVTASFIVTCRKAYRAWTFNRYALSIFLLALAAILGTVDFTAVDIQSLQQTLGINFDTALAQLGLNIVLITHLRSVVTIAMAAVVALSNHTVISTAHAPKRHLVLFDGVLNKIAPLIPESEQEESALIGVSSGQNNVSSSEPLSGQKSEPPSFEGSGQEGNPEVFTRVNSESRQGNPISMAAGNPRKPRKAGGNQATNKGAGDASKRVYKVLRVNPAASLTEIEQKAGVSRSYASKIRVQFQKEQALLVAKAPIALPQKERQNTGETLGMMEQRMYDTLSKDATRFAELLRLSDTMTVPQLTAFLKKEYRDYAVYITEERVGTVLTYARQMHPELHNGHHAHEVPGQLVEIT